MGLLDQNARFGAPAACYQNSRRSGQPQSTRACHDQHGDHRAQADGPVTRRQSPDQQRRRSHYQHQRHEPSHDPIGQALNLGLRFLGPPNQFHNLRQRRVARGARHAGRERALPVDRTGQNLAPGPLVHGQRLAGEPRFVHAGVARDDFPIQWHFLTRPHNQRFTDAHFAGRHADDLSAARHIGHRGRQVEQLANGCRSTPLGPGLQILAQRDEHQNHSGVHQVHGALARRMRRGKHDVDARRVGGQRADRHQRVHVGRQVPGPPPSSDVIGPAHGRLQHGGTSQLSPHRRGIRRRPKVQRHQRRQQGHAPPQPPAPAAQLALAPLGQVSAGCLGSSGCCGLVPCLLDGFDQARHVPRPVAPFDRRLIRRQVDPRRATPGTASRAFSTRATQLAQVMPSTFNKTSRRSSAGAVLTDGTGRVGGFVAMSFGALRLGAISKVW